MPKEWWWKAQVAPDVMHQWILDELGLNMAFIVEMVWGRPDKLVVYGLDADGELVPSHTLPSGFPPDLERRAFSCHYNTWQKVLDIGRKAGWKPLGTIPTSASQEAWQKLGRFENNYEPEEWQYAKHFQTKDAEALADALERLVDSGEVAESEGDSQRPFLIRNGMTEEELAQANRGISPEFFHEFIVFLRKGCFDFAFDD